MAGDSGKLRRRDASPGMAMTNSEKIVRAAVPLIVHGSSHLRVRVPVYEYSSISVAECNVVDAMTLKSQL
jgi:hypothetical protein